VSYVIGIALALAIYLLARVAGFDRDRSFYPTVLIVIASYYVLFAVMGQSTQALMLETTVMALFAAVAITGYKSKPWLVVTGLAAHGAFDFVHHRLIANPGVPAWWPAFCLSIDVGLAVMVASNLRQRPKQVASRVDATA
jgi:hypothetical protein